MRLDNDITFIAKRYRKGKFHANEGWQRLGISRSKRWPLIKMAAAVAGVIFLTASAAIVFNLHTGTQSESPQNVESGINPQYTVRVIDFENTALPIVIEKIEATYGVEVLNIPQNADSLSLSLHYEGNAMDLVETINDILDTKMTIKD